MCFWIALVFEIFASSFKKVENFVRDNVGLKTEI